MAAAAEDIAGIWKKEEGRRKNGAVDILGALRRRERGRLDDANAVVRSDALRLTAAYESSLYAPTPSAPRANEDRRWTALWVALRRLWLAKWWR